MSAALNIDTITRSRDVSHSDQVLRAIELLRSRAESDAPYRRDFRVCTWDHYTDAAYLEAVARFVKAQTADTKWSVTVWLERHSPYGPEVNFKYLGDKHVGGGKITFVIAYPHSYGDEGAVAAAIKFVESQGPDSKWQYCGPAAHGQMQCPQITFEYLGNLH